MTAPVDDWLRESLLQAKGPGYAERVLEQVALGMKAGGAIRGVQVLVSTDACESCRTLAGIVYDPEIAPELPVATCARGGCRCAYATVMLYDDGGVVADHRPKSTAYGAKVLQRLRTGCRARGAINAIRIAAAPDACAPCHSVSTRVWAPSSAPLIPLQECSRVGGCRCAYVPTWAHSSGDEWLPVSDGLA